MTTQEIFESFGNDKNRMIQGIFSSIFIIQNRMQTAGEKIQTEISMKQWLLIAMTLNCPEPRTLTNVGNLMGCSRQNVKKLAAALEKTGFVELRTGKNNSVSIEPTEKASKYFADIAPRHEETLKLLFQDFSEDELAQLYKLFGKLYAGVERVEKYSEGLSK